MSLTHANQTASVSVLTVLSDIPVSQSEIANVVAFARQGQTYRFVSMVVGSEAIEAAIKQGLVVCEKDVLSVPVVEAPVAPVAEPVIKNVEPTTEQCVISDIEPQDELAKQIETCSQSNDVAYRLHAAMLAECTGQDWWSATIKEAEEEMKLTNLIEPIILDPQLKLRQATLTKQIFTGDYSAVKRNAEVLSIGGSLTVRMRRHGKNGCWLLIVEATDHTTSQQVAA